MHYDVYIKKITGDLGILSSIEGEDFIEVPLKYLPEKSREGDVLKLKLSFDAFKTLKWSKDSSL